MDLLTELPACTKCALHQGRTQVVIGRGNPSARVLFIGEAPGEQEDLQGKPFVGRAGQLLTRLLDSIDLRDADYYITNVVKCRPPGNRDPAPEEIRACTPYLLEQIRRMRPAVIVTLGNYATKYVLAGFDPSGMARIQGIGALHGRARPMTVDGLRFTAFPSYHPAAVLHNPPLAAALEHDMLALKSLLHAPAQSPLDKFI